MTDETKTVPLASLEAERAKRQALEARIAELEPLAKSATELQARVTALSAVEQSAKESSAKLAQAEARWGARDALGAQGIHTSEALVVAEAMHRAQGGDAPFADWLGKQGEAKWLSAYRPTSAAPVVVAPVVPGAQPPAPPVVVAPPAPNANGGAVQPPTPPSEYVPGSVARMATANPKQFLADMRAGKIPVN